jgi:hypothetical protein
MPKRPESKSSTGYDRVDLTTRVNAFLCQSDAHNKLGPKTLNVHRFPCRDPFFGFLVRKAPCMLCDGNFGGNDLLTGNGTIYIYIYNSTLKALTKLYKNNFFNKKSKFP